MIALGSGSVVTAVLSALMGSIATPSPLLIGAQHFLGIFLAMMSLLTLFGSHAAKAAMALTIGRERDESSREWADLLAAIDSEEVEEPSARASMNRLQARLAHATYRSGDVGIVDSEKLNRRAAIRAAEELEQRYGGTSEIHQAPAPA